MKALPVLLGLGAVVLIGSKSSKSSKPTEKVIYQAGTIIAPKNKDPDKESPKCTSVQYLNAEGICQTFWNDQTPAKVKKELEIQLKGYDLKNKSTLCDQEDKGNGLELNPTHVKVLSNVITKLWPQVKASQLPPNNKSPLYIILLWQKATEVYYDMVCGIAADLPPIT